MCLEPYTCDHGVNLLTLLGCTCATDALGFACVRCDVSATHSYCLRCGDMKVLDPATGRCAASCPVGSVVHVPDKTSPEGRECR